MNTKIFFATDIHGSTPLFENWCAAAFNSRLAPQVLILGGDLLGKEIVPIIEQADGTLKRPGSAIDVPLSLRELRLFEQELERVGKYGWRCTAEEYQALASDPVLAEKKFQELASARLLKWLEHADKVLGDSAAQAFVGPGNDDPSFVDEILKYSQKLQNPDGKVVSLDLRREVEMLSLGYTNPTPLDTPRETNETELSTRLRDLAKGLHDPESAVFNLHCPPAQTKIDNAFGAGHVGSTAVRALIEEARPALGLHGHIHESKNVCWVGDTPCLNPGSRYEQGQLEGALIEFREGRVDPEGLFLVKASGSLLHKVRHPVKAFAQFILRGGWFSNK